MPNEKESTAQVELTDLASLKGSEFEPYSGLLEECPTKELKQGEVLIQAGEANKFLYLLVSGRLKIQLKLEMDAIAVLEPGEVVGIVAERRKVMIPLPTEADLVGNQFDLGNPG